MKRYLLAALTVELDKMRRAPLLLICSLVIVLAPTLLASAAIIALRTDALGGFADKARLLVQGTGWQAYLDSGAQVMSVAVLLALGFGYAWCFGREFTDGTVVNLFALPVSRGDLAAAKLIALALWSGAVVVLSCSVLLLGGLALQLSADDGVRWWVPFVVCVLTACNTVPLAWVATAGRGYLGSLGALLGLVVATQLLVAVGAGAWFPWALPGLLAGFGGAGVDVHALQVFLPVVVAALGAAATVRAWRRLELGDA